MQEKGWLRQGTEVGIVPARAVLRLAAGFGPWDIESSPRIAFVRCGVVRRSRAEHRFVRKCPAHRHTHTYCLRRTPRVIAAAPPQIPPPASSAREQLSS